MGEHGHALVIVGIGGGAQRYRNCGSLCAQFEITPLERLQRGLVFEENKLRPG
jgi:hypothetical protein